MPAKKILFFLRFFATIFAILISLLVKDIFLTSGAVKEIKNEIDFYKEKALKSIEAFPVSNKSKELFNNLTLALMKRKL